jgi:hypothetical protein
MPPGWAPDSANDGPLSGFLGGTGGTGPQSRQDRKLASQVAVQFEQCMGIGAAADRFFGPGGSRPTASSSSPAFAAPVPSTAGPAQQAGSMVSVFPSNRAISADVAQMSNPKFPGCFGAALGTSFIGAATNAGAGNQLGQPVVQSIAHAASGGVASAGAVVTIPLNRQGTVVPIAYGIVLIGGGRAEASLYTFSEQTPFPATLQSSLAQILAGNIASESAGTVA